MADVDNAARLATFLEKQTEVRQASYYSELLGRAVDVAADEQALMRAAVDAKRQLRNGYRWRNFVDVVGAAVPESHKSKAATVTIWNNFMASTRQAVAAVAAAPAPSQDDLADQLHQFSSVLQTLVPTMKRLEERVEKIDEHIADVRDEVLAEKEARLQDREELEKRIAEGQVNAGKVTDETLAKAGKDSGELASADTDIGRRVSSLVYQFSVPNTTQKTMEIRDTRQDMIDEVFQREPGRPALDRSKVEGSGVFSDLKRQVGDIELLLQKEVVDEQFLLRKARHYIILKLRCQQRSAYADALERHWFTSSVFGKPTDECRTLYEEEKYESRLEGIGSSSSKGNDKRGRGAGGGGGAKSKRQRSSAAAGDGSG